MTELNNLTKLNNFTSLRPSRCPRQNPRTLWCGNRGPITRTRMKRCQNFSWTSGTYRNNTPIWLFCLRRKPLAVTKSPHSAHWWAIVKFLSELEAPGCLHGHGLKDHQFWTSSRCAWALNVAAYQQKATFFPVKIVPKMCVSASRWRP